MAEKRTHRGFAELRIFRELGLAVTQGRPVTVAEAMDKEFAALGVPKNRVGIFVTEAQVQAVLEALRRQFA